MILNIQIIYFSMYMKYDKGQKKYPLKMSMTELKGHNVQPPTLYKPGKGFKGLFAKMPQKNKSIFYHYTLIH